MNGFSIVHVIAGLGFFLYGLRNTEVNLRQAAGDKIRRSIGRLTKNPFRALLLGFMITLVFQSSTAAAVMLIGLAGIGYIEVRRAAAVVLGADVGTTVLVLLLASFVRFNTTEITLGILVTAFMATFIFRHGRALFFAQAFLGFAFVIFGLNQVVQASVPIRESALVGQVISAISSNGLAALFLAAALTALVQSSAAVIGIILSFAGVGVLTLEQAVPFVLGANVGSTVVPYLVGLRSRTNGRRLAFLHVTSKLLGAAIVFPWIGLISSLIHEYGLSPSFEVAAFHISFNVFLVALLVPFTGVGTNLAIRFVPETEDSKRFGAKYLDAQALDTPTLAFTNVFREIIRMAEMAQEMVSQVLLAFEEVGTETILRLEEMDDQIDHLDRDIKFYLARVSQTQLVPEQSKRQLELLMLTHDLEQIGDVVTKDLLELAQKKRRKNVAFSAEGWNEIKDFHRKVVENFHLAVNSFASNDVELGQKVMRHKKRLAQIEQDLGQKHLLRLHHGLRESFDTSSIHLDLLSNLRRINTIVTKMAYPVLDRRQA